MENIFDNLSKATKCFEVKAQQKKEKKKRWFLSKQYLGPLNSGENESSGPADETSPKEKRSMKCLLRAAKTGMQEGVLTGVFVGGCWGIFKFLNESLGQLLSSLNNNNGAPRGSKSVNENASEKDNKRKTSDSNKQNNAKSPTADQENKPQQNNSANSVEKNKSTAEGESTAQINSSRLSNLKNVDYSIRESSRKPSKFENILVAAPSFIKHQEQVEIVGYAFIQTTGSQGSNGSDSDDPEAPKKPHKGSHGSQESQESQPKKEESGTSKKTKGNSGSKIPSKQGSTEPSRSVLVESHEPNQSKTTHQSILKSETSKEIAQEVSQKSIKSTHPSVIKSEASKEIAQEVSQKSLKTSKAPSKTRSTAHSSRLGVDNLGSKNIVEASPEKEIEKSAQPSKSILSVKKSKSRKSWKDPMDQDSSINVLPSAKNKSSFLEDIDVISNGVISNESRAQAAQPNEVVDTTMSEFNDGVINNSKVSSKAQSVKAFTESQKSVAPETISESSKKSGVKKSSLGGSNTSTARDHAKKSTSLLSETKLNSEQRVSGAKASVQGILTEQQTESSRKASVESGATRKTVSSLMRSVAPTSAEHSRHSVVPASKEQSKHSVVSPRREKSEASGAKAADQSSVQKGQSADGHGPRTFSLLSAINDNIILFSACNCAIVLGVVCTLISTTRASFSIIK